MSVMRKLALGAADFLHTHEGVHMKLMNVFRSIQMAPHCHHRTLRAWSGQAAASHRRL
jgi:hypothetical protein